MSVEIPKVGIFDLVADLSCAKGGVDGKLRWENLGDGNLKAK